MKQRYECLADVKTVAMVFTLDDARLPFEKWMLYDVAKEIENAINEAAAEQTREGIINAFHLFLVYEQNLPIEQIYVSKKI